MADFARATRLRELRARHHLSQEEAAHEIGVSVKSLRAWEHGGGIRWRNAKSIAAFYGVEPESLVSRELDGDQTQGADDVDLREIASRLAVVEAQLAELLTLLQHERSMR